VAQKSKPLLNYQNIALNRIKACQLYSNFSSN